MASYSIVKSLHTGAAAFAVVASDTEAHYVFPSTESSSELNERRVSKLVKRLEANGKSAPASPHGWTRLLLMNVGHYGSEPPVEVETIEEAEAQARALLPSQNIPE